jgi:hypothetical protein
LSHFDHCQIGLAWGEPPSAHALDDAPHVHFDRCHVGVVGLRGDGRGRVAPDAGK